jgi:succinoglycan biosynthesis transport protein ExoP
MELKQMIYVLPKWAWLLILGFVLGVVGGIVVSKLQSPVYEATTKVLITRPPRQSSDPASILDDQQSTQMFMQFATIQSVLDDASAKLGFKVNKNNIQVKLTTDLQIIQVTVADQNPARSALIANTLAEVAIKQYSDIQTGRYAVSEENIQVQIDSVESQISNLLDQIDLASTSNLDAQIQQIQTQMLPLQEEVNKLQLEIASLTPPVSTDQRTKIAEDQARINEITPMLSLYQQIYSNLVILKEPIPASSAEIQIANLQSALDLYKKIYTSLVSDLETIRLAKLNNTYNASQIELAIAPKRAVRPNLMLNALLAGVCGLMLAGGSMLLIEYLDDSLKSSDDVKQFLGIPVIGYIAEKKKNRKDKEKIMVAEESHSPMNDSFRSLKTNLEFIRFGKQTKTILVTSPEQAEGKTTIAANLAVMFAREGKQVLLLDADMRQPALHQLFNIPNRAGLSDVLHNELDLETAGRVWKKSKNLKVIPSGPLTPDSIELLGSEKMRQVLADLEKSFDTILIDTPPCFIADAQTLADKVDAILLVIRPGHTRRDSAIAALEQFKRAGANIAGVVLSRTHRGTGSNDNAYRYYSQKSGASNGKREGFHKILAKKLASWLKPNRTISNTEEQKKPDQNNPPEQM